MQHKQYFEVHIQDHLQFISRNQGTWVREILCMILIRDGHFPGGTSFGGAIARTSWVQYLPNLEGSRKRVSWSLTASLASLTHVGDVLPLPDVPNCTNHETVCFVRMFAPVCSSWIEMAANYQFGRLCQFALHRSTCSFHSAPPKNFWLLHKTQRLFLLTKSIFLNVHTSPHRFSFAYDTAGDKRGRSLCSQALENNNKKEAHNSLICIDYYDYYRVPQSVKTLVFIRDYKHLWAFMECDFPQKSIYLWGFLYVSKIQCNLI